MNKANKIDARYSVAQPIQRNWEGYLCSLNKQQFSGIVRKGHYLCIFRELSTRIVQQNPWVVLLFNGKIQCSSQSAPLGESRKRSRDGPCQKRSRAIMAPSFFDCLGLIWSLLLQLQ